MYGVVIVSYMIGENLNTIGKSRKPEEKNHQKSIKIIKYLKRNGREAKIKRKNSECIF